MLYQKELHEILILIDKLAREKKLNWTLNQETRTFSTRIDCNLFVEIKEDLIPPRWYFYGMKIWDENETIVIKDQDEILKNLFQFLLNTPTSRRKTRPLKEWLDNVIKILKSITEIEKTEKKNKKKTAKTGKK